MDLEINEDMLILVSRGNVKNLNRYFKTLENVKSFFKQYMAYALGIAV